MQARSAVKCGTLLRAHCVQRYMALTRERKIRSWWRHYTILWHVVLPDIPAAAQVSVVRCRSAQMAGSGRSAEAAKHQGRQRALTSRKWQAQSDKLYD